MRRAVVAVLSAAAGFAVVVGAGGGTGSLRELVRDVVGAPPSPAVAPRLHVSATTYAPVATTTIDGPAIDYGYGVLQLAVTFANHRIEQVGIAHFVAADGYSAALEQAAIPVLDAEVLRAQGLPIDVVTGATYTSEAYATSLQAVLDRERLAHP